uniref:Si:ch73-7i4.3 n=1 Tax=Cyprinus carpio carpio TaxID=630221 RepID=A0A9J8CLM8_CYPCA
MEDGKTETVRIHTLNVTLHSYNGEKRNRLIYRQSSSNSDVLLICKSSKTYESLKWTWEPKPNSRIDLIAFEKEIQVQLKEPNKRSGIRSSTKYNSQALIFHISPVYFNYRGTYRCITEISVYTTIILHTIRVSVEPPDGVLRNQSVVLTCELSEVTGSVMLVWLRMEGNRGVLVKQQIMTKKNNKLQLTVNLSSYESDLMNWQCAVFTENTLRALAPITNSLNLSDLSTETLTVTNQEDTMTQDSHLHIVITVACAVSVSVLILLGLLVFKYQRKTGADSWFKSRSISSEVLDCSTTVIYSASPAQ